MKPAIRAQILLSGAALLGVYAFAIWVRLNYIAIYGGTGDYLAWALENYFGGITREYLGAAKEILESGSYSTVAYPPGYPVLMALLYSVGITDLQQLRIAQAGIDSTGIFAFFLLLYLVGVHRAICWVSALMYAAYPLWAAGSTFLLAESLSPVLVLWILVGLVHVARSSHRIGWAAMGAGIGLAGLTRPDLMLLIGAAILWALVAGGKVGRLRAVVMLCAGFALPVGAWGAHNRMQHGVWLFTTTGGGVGLWEGLGILPNEYGYVLSDEYTVRMLQARGMEWHSLEADRYLKREYLRAWREHPEYVLKVILHRWDKILRSSESFSPNVFMGVQQFLDRHGALLSLIVLFLVRRNPAAVLVVAAPVTYALLSIGLVHWEARYVRYVHIGYVAAVALLLSQVYSKMYSSPVIGRRTVWARAVAGLPLLAFLFLLPLSSKALVHKRMNVEIGSRLSSESTRGALVGGPGLRDLEWTAIGGAMVETSDGGMTVETTSAPYEYQAVARIGTRDVKGIFLTYEVAVERGGALVGILDEQGTWLATAKSVGSGRHEGKIATGVIPNREITLVVANHNPDGSSRFKLKNLQVHFSKR